MDYTTLNTAAEILEAFRACNNSGEEIALFEYLATRPDAPVGAFVEILKKIKLEPLLALTIQAFGKITNAGIKANLQQSENLLIMLSQQAESGSSDLIKWSAATAITEIGFDFFMVAQYLSEAPEQIAGRIVKLKNELGRGSDEFVRFSKYGPLHSRWRDVESLMMKPPHELKLVSPDGQTLFSRGSDDNTIKIWQVGKGEVCSLIGHTEDYNIKDIAITPDGQTLFSCADRTIRMWQVSTGQELHCITSYGQIERLANYSIPNLVISPDGQTLFSIEGGTIRMWQVSTRQELHRITSYTNVDSLAISPDGQTLFGIVAGAIQIWQVSTGKELWTFSSYGYSSPYTYVSISPDGKTIFTHRIDMRDKGDNPNKDRTHWVHLWRLDSF